MVLAVSVALLNQKACPLVQHYVTLLYIKFITSAKATTHSLFRTQPPAARKQAIYNTPHLTYLLEQVLSTRNGLLRTTYS